MVNEKAKGKCKKHNVGKLEYLKNIYSDKTTFLCPVCCHIRAIRGNIKRAKQETKRKIAFLKKEIKTEKNRLSKSLLNLVENINYNNKHPQDFFEREIKHRKEFNKQHKKGGG